MNINQTKKSMATNLNNMTSNQTCKVKKDKIRMETIKMITNFHNRIRILHNKILILLRKVKVLKVHQNKINHLLLLKMTFLTNSDKIIMRNCHQSGK
jgi:hypothetical protein